MMCVAWCRFVVGCVAGLTLLSACAAEQPAALTDSTIDAGTVRTAPAGEAETVRDARDATEEAVQRISGLASVAVSAVRELGKGAARSVIGISEADTTAVVATDAWPDAGENETGPE